MPYFNWYPADAETDENYRSMSDAEVGFYHRYLNHSWLNHGLPFDPDERWRVLGRPKSYCEKAWIRVGKCFVISPSDPNRIVNPRQERQRRDAELKSESAAQSASKRWDKNQDAFAMRSHMRSQSEGTARASESVFVSEKVKKEKYLEEPDFDPDSRFKAFVNRHPGVRTRIGACRSQYIGLIGSNGSPAHMADVLDEKHVKWGEYWKSSKAPPLGLLAYLADGDALSDPPEIDRSLENRTRVAMTADKIWSEQPKNSGAQYMSEEETRLYLEGLVGHPGRKQAS